MLPVYDLVIAQFPWIIFTGTAFKDVIANSFDYMRVIHDQQYFRVKRRPNISGRKVFL